MKLSKCLLSGSGYAIMLLILVLNLSGCALGVRNDDGPETDTRVIALSNSRDVIALNAEDIVRVMQQAGFSDKQILELGTDLRNALASSGAAQILVGEVVEAIFAVRGNYLHVSGYRRGSFIFNSETGEIR